MRIIAALAIALTAGCAGGAVNWSQTGRAWVDSVCRDAGSTDAHCRERGVAGSARNRY